MSGQAEAGTMSGHDIVVIGASAGGLKALGAVLSELPAGLPAAVFVVQHLAADQKSRLPKLLGDVSRLPVRSPNDGDRFQQGCVYVAAPDHHLLLRDDRVRVHRGPQENRFRPSIDALFRSAARSYGSRVVGVVLTGSLYDGSVGLQAIKMRGGITIVQDPDEAEYPSMPRTALRYVKVDHIAPIADAGALLVRMVAEPPVDQAGFPTTAEIEIESNIAEQVMDTRQFLESVERIGTRTTYSCPDCSGAMWQIGDGEPLKLRCHVGHSFTGEVLSTGQSRSIEASLWTAIRLMEEKVTFSRQLAERKREQSMQDAADGYEREAVALDEQITKLRDIIASGSASLRFISEDLK